MGGEKCRGVDGKFSAVVKDGDTVITADVDGDRAADLQIVLSGVVSLTADDFVL
jgi:hypothetical protein